MKKILLVASLLLASASAHAESSKWFSAELGAGGVRMTGDNVKTVYGKKDQPVIHARAGVLIKSILDIGIGGDFTQITGKRVGTVGGGTSAEPTQLTLGPMTGTGLIRLDIFHNQPVVPYLGGGISYLVWGERDRLGGKNITGDKYGWMASAASQFSSTPSSPRARRISTPTTASTTRSSRSKSRAPNTTGSEKARKASTSRTGPVARRSSSSSKSSLRRGDHDRVVVEVDCGRP